MHTSVRAGTGAEVIENDRSEWPNSRGGRLPVTMSGDNTSDVVAGIESLSQRRATQINWPPVRRHDFGV